MKKTPAKKKPAQKPPVKPAVKPTSKPTTKPKQKPGPKPKNLPPVLPGKPNSKYAKPPGKVAKPVAPKGERLANAPLVALPVKRIAQNGYTRPSEKWAKRGTPKVTFIVWRIADEISAKNKRPATRKDMIAALAEHNKTATEELRITEAVFTNQFYRWRKFNGIFGQKRTGGPVKPVVPVAAPVAPAKPALVATKPAAPAPKPPAAKKPAPAPVKPATAVPAAPKPVQTTLPFAVPAPKPAAVPAA